MELLWLGYDGLSLPYSHVSAVLIYQSALAERVRHSYGRVPANIRAVVVTQAGDYFPSSWSVEHLRARLAHWRNIHAPERNN